MDDFLSPYEAEHLIISVKEIDIAEYGSKAYETPANIDPFRWLNQHETIDRLNI